MTPLHTTKPASQKHIVHGSTPQYLTTPASQCTTKQGSHHIACSTSYNKTVHFNTQLRLHYNTEHHRTAHCSTEQYSACNTLQNCAQLNKADTVHRLQYYAFTWNIPKLPFFCGLQSPRPVPNPAILSIFISCSPDTIFALNTI